MSCKSYLVSTARPCSSPVGGCRAASDSLIQIPLKKPHMCFCFCWDWVSVCSTPATTTDGGGWLTETQAVRSAPTPEPKPKPKPAPPSEDEDEDGCHRCQCGCCCRGVSGFAGWHKPRVAERPGSHATDGVQQLVRQDNMHSPTEARVHPQTTRAHTYKRTHTKHTH